MKLRLVTATAAAFLVGTLIAPVHAGPASDAIAALEVRVDALDARVEALEAAWPTVAPTPTATSPTPSPSPIASPSPQPTAAPTTAPPSATPSPVPSTAPSPTPTSTPPAPTSSPATPALGSRPASGALDYNGNCPSVIENKTFRDLGANVIAIRLVNCANVTIRDVDFINVAEGVYAVGSSNIRIERTRYQNITGPYERVGLNRANLVQFNGVTGGYIGANKGRCGDTEDIVSVYKSSNVVIEDNHFEGAYQDSPGCLAWRSSSGTCIIVGDSSGNGNIIRRNVCVNPGQVGIAIAGGQNNRAEDNLVIGEQRVSPASNIAYYVANFGGGTCANNALVNNVGNYRNAAGSLNLAWTPGTCTGTTSSGNVNDTSLVAADYRVTFP